MFNLRVEHLKKRQTEQNQTTGYPYRNWRYRQIDNNDFHIKKINPSKKWEIMIDNC